LLQDAGLLKPLIAACNMGKRALRKDLDLEVDTFNPKLNKEQAVQVATYLHPLLPKVILIETLIALDAYQWVDSAIRKIKGRWERQFVSQLKQLKISCKKRKYEYQGQEFELDIAYPDKGDIRVGVDVKMIGHPSDKYKRSDEIVNKAVKFKQVYPDGVFVSLLYYPFEEDRQELEDRLRHGTEEIAEVIFAGDDDESVADAVRRIARLCSPISGGLDKRQG